MPKGIYEHKLHSEKTKSKMSNSHKGKKRKPHTEETKRRISNFWKKWWSEKSKEERAKATEKCRQFNHTPQANEKRHKSQKKRWAKMTKEERLTTTEVKQKISKSVKKYWNKMTKEKIVQVTQAFQKAGQEAIHKKITEMTKEERRKYLKEWIKAGHTNPSSIEKAICKALDVLSINYKTQVSFDNGKFIADIYVPAQRLIIECNGDYWHNYEIFPKRKIRDDAFEKYANDNEFKLTWLWEHDIRENPKSALINSLKKYF